MRKKLIWFFTLTCSSSAFAGPVGWTVSEASGTVRISQGGIQKIATRGLSIAAGDTVTTGRDGRAVLVRGTEVMMVAPASQLHLPAQEQTAGFTRVVEEFGNVVFMIKKKMTPHFEVKTPYLAAVVKGTTFSVGVTPQGASVQVLEGAVDVATSDGRAHDLITPGAIALVGATNRFRMRIEDNGKTRVVESPAAHDQDNGAHPAPTGPVAASPTAAAGDVGVATPDATPLVASSAPAAGITAAVYEPPVSLASSTNGLVSGSVGGDLAALGTATRIASESSVSAAKAVQTASTLIAIQTGATQAMDSARKVELASSAASDAKVAADRMALDTAAAAERAAADAAKAQADQQASAAAKAAAASAADAAAAAAATAADAATAAAADQQAKAAAQQQSEAAAAAAASAAQIAAKAAAQAAANATAVTDISAQSAADQAAKDAQKAADTAAKAADDAAKQSAKAASDAAQAAGERAARDAAKAASDAAASKAADEARKAGDDAAKAAVDKSMKDAEQVAKKAAEAVAKAAADAAKQIEHAAKDAQKTADDAAKAAAKAADDAAKAAGKAADEAAKQIAANGKGK